MTITKIELRELKADKGMVLTNGEAFSSVGGSVFLGINDSADNWQEISAEEAEQMKETQSLENSVE